MNEILSFKELIKSLERKSKDEICFCINDQEYSYEAVLKKAHTLSSVLRKEGISKGDRIAVWLPNCFEWIVLLLAIGNIGAILVPLNSRFKEEDAKYVLNHSGSRILFTQSKFLNTSYEQIIEGWNNTSDKFSSQEVPMLEKVVFIDPNVPNFAYQWDDLFNINEESQFSDKEDTIYEDDPILIQYTSGTTAFPKGALLTQKNVLLNGFHFGKRLHLTHEDRVFSAGPFGHIGGVTMQIIMSLTHGVPFYSTSYFDPREAMRLVDKYKCTTYSGIDSLFLLLMDHPDFDKSLFSSVRTGWTTGSYANLKLIKEKMGIPYLQCSYGLSEASPNVSICDLADPVEKQVSTCGRAHEGCEIGIINSDTNEFLPYGQVGEIVTRGYNVMKEYYRDPEETYKTFLGDWLKTGDLGSLDEDGFLKFHGRLKDIIRMGGENFSPLEVEGYLYKHPNIELIAIIGLPDTKYGEIPIAVIKTKQGNDISLEEMKRFLEGKVASYKVPRKIIKLDEFPITESGKIQKNLLKTILMEV